MHPGYSEETDYQPKNHQALGSQQAALAGDQHVNDQQSGQFER